ncbi:MAG TPA: DUF3386 family protein [Pirellulales bacterium]
MPLARMLIGSACLWALLAGPAQAHFVWIGVGRFQPIAEVWFSEQPEPGDPQLLDRIRQTQAWVRTPDGRQQPLKLEMSQNQVEPALVATLPAAAPRSIEAVCRYGVFKRGDKPRLLTYYAKHLDLHRAQPPSADPKLAALRRSRALELDIEPRPTTTGMAFHVWWQDQPAAGVEVTFYSGDAPPQAATTDAHGRVEWNKSLARLAVRAGLVEPERRGNLQGQAYDGALHYSTLTMTGEGEAVRQASAAEPIAALDAPEVLKRAREARGVWRDFPGFRARLEVELTGYTSQGDLVVTPDGQIQLQGFAPGGDLKQAEGYLDSLVQHRLADTGADENVEFVTENESHPLGRMLRFKGDEQLQSTYRVRGDVITQVNREMGDMRFSIAVLEVHRTPDQKNLPQVFTVSFWKKASGELERTETHVNQWLRVGRFDLPRKIVQLRATNGGTTVMELTLSEHQLGTAATAPKLIPGK